MTARVGEGPRDTRLEAPGGRKLGHDFYARPVLEVARDCVGKLLVHQTADGLTAGRIVECEAYRGPEDRAAHSWRGRTRRTEVMFGPAGRAYVFMLYGSCWAFNLVTSREGEPHAVLVRAIEPLFGLELMQNRRGLPTRARDLTNGPGKLCQALAITGSDYGRDLAGDELYLADGPRGRLGRSPRINVDYAGAWAKRPWRFFERGNPYISVPPRE